MSYAVSWFHFLYATARRKSSRAKIDRHRRLQNVSEATTGDLLMLG